MSVRRSTSSPDACSGDMYATVPSVVSAFVIFESRPQLRESEVQDLRLTPRREHDVPRLDVPVDDPLLVGLAQPFADLDRDRDRLIDRERSLLDPILERSPSKNSITMNNCPSGSSISWIVQMLGWSSAETAWASCMKRVLASSSG